MKPLGCVLLFVFAFMSCSNVKQHEELLSNYLQVTGKVKTDLSFELLKLTDLDSTWTSSDSLNYFLDNLDYESYLRTFAKEGMVLSTFNTSQIDSLADSWEGAGTYLTGILDSLSEVHFDSESKRLIRKGRKTVDSLEYGTMLIRRLNMVPNQVLMEFYNAKYSMKNPKLNFVTQEFNALVGFDKDISKILYFSLLEIDK